ncbi:hypothetical protein [Ochrobactrum quorumnocens]|nr:hypothetical protein [[Ochrobactrum] quorumnocens]
MNEDFRNVIPVLPPALCQQQERSQQIQKERAPSGIKFSEDAL